MPRNGSGTSSVINNFVIDTIADPDEVNANFTDVADQLTNSLPRDGQAGMNAPLPLQNGTVALPALTFTSDADTGFYRKGANQIGWSEGGVDVTPNRGTVYYAKSGDYTALGTDNNSVLRFTAAATLSLTAAATLGANWHCWVMADGGPVIIDPDSAETINGSATITIPNGFSVQVICDGSNFRASKDYSTVTSAIPDFVQGLTLSNNATDANNDIDITTGQAKGNSKSVVNSATMTKRLDAAWASGTGNGGLDTGAKANSTTYHVHAIVNNTTGAFDALFSTSVSSPTVTSGWTLVQRLGSVVTDGSGNLRPFIQDGSDFYWNTALASLTADVSVTSTSAAALRTCNLPSGLRVLGRFQINLQTADGDRVTTWSISDAVNQNITKAASIYASTATKASDAVIEQYSNTSRQIYVGINMSGTSSTATTLKTIGWRDYQVPRI